MVEKFLSSVLASATVSTVLLAALSFLLRGWITERLKNAIKYEYDRDMESYKNMLVRVHTATAEGQKAAIERRMKAFDRLWKVMLAIKKSTSVYNYHFDIRTKAEWLSLPSDSNFRSHIGGLDDDAILLLLGDAAIEEERPYVGEIVWSLFFAYRSFNVRLIHLARSSLSNPSAIDWIADLPTRGMLSAAVSVKEIEELDRLEIGKVDFVCGTIENKVLHSWKKLISGVEFGDEALKHAGDLLKAVKKF